MALKSKQRKLYGKHITTIYELFQQIDKNKDGFVSNEELSRGVESLGLGISVKETRALIMILDTEGGNMITYDDFNKIFHPSTPHQLAHIGSSTYSKLQSARAAKGDGVLDYAHPHQPARQWGVAREDPGRVYEDDWGRPSHLDHYNEAAEDQVEEKAGVGPGTQGSSLTDERNAAVRAIQLRNEAKTLFDKDG